MPGFAFVVDYDGTLTPEQNAARRGPDYLVRVPNDHPLFGIGSAYFRQDGAAALPAGAVAVVAVIPDCMALGFLEGLVCDVVIGPPDIRPFTVPIISSPSSSAALSTWQFLGSARKFQILAS